MNIRVGQGFDVHAFSDQGDHIVLGGVRIPSPQSLEAHSDGDVLLHAIMDALLGALALGDIGKHFPDTDPAFKGADSLTLLARVHEMLRQRGARVVNLDSTVVAQRPRLAPHIDAMRTRIAECLEIDRDCIGIKATTSEGLGFTGRGEGVACMATVLLEISPR